MPLNRRSATSIAKLFAAALLVTAAAQPAGPQALRGQGPQPRPGVVHSNFGPGDTLVFSVPQFVATAVAFRASDETGWDKWGADEVKAVFANFNPIQQNLTVTYGNVDSGETKNFAASDRCIALQTNCENGQSELHFGIALWEEDRAPWPFANWCNGWLAGEIAFYYSEPCSGDDFIGRIEAKHLTADLVAALPTVGASTEFTVKPTGGAGSYTVTYRITRLANIDRTIVIHLPPDILAPTITLQGEAVTIGGQKGVRLTWSGATTNPVDIYRDGVKLGTTANDGDHVVPATAGTFQFRVCDLNSTTACSADVTVVV